MIVLDENLSQRASRMLDAFDNRRQVKSVLDFLDKGSKDVDILQYLAKMDPKPAFVTKDNRILHKPEERQALKAAGISIVLLTSSWKDLKWPEIAWRLVKVWPSLIEEVESAKHPTVFEVHAGKALKVQRVRPVHEL